MPDLALTHSDYDNDLALFVLGIQSFDKFNELMLINFRTDLNSHWVWDASKEFYLNVYKHKVHAHHPSVWSFIQSTTYAQSGNNACRELLSSTKPHTAESTPHATQTFHSYVLTSSYEWQLNWNTPHTTYYAEGLCSQHWCHWHCLPCNCEFFCHCAPWTMNCAVSHTGQLFDQLSLLFLDLMTKWCSCIG